MPKSAKPTDYLVPYSVGESHGVKFLNFRMGQDENGHYSYATVKLDFSEVVEYDGHLYKRTGWDSDHGTVIYKATTLDKVVKPHLSTKLG